MKSEELGIFLKRKKVTVSVATKDQLVHLIEMMMINVTIKLSFKTYFSYPNLRSICTGIKWSVD
jgi:hypothetical protein